MLNKDKFINFPIVPYIKLSFNLNYNWQKCSAVENAPGWARTTILSVNPFG